MGNRSTLVSVAMLALCAAGCDQDPAPVAAPLLSQTAARFAVLGQLLERAAPLLEAAQGFRPADPMKRAAPLQLGVVLPRRYAGALRLAAGPVVLEVRPLGTVGGGARGIVQGRALVFAGAYQAADSFFVAQRERVEELVLLHGPAAPRRFSYQLLVTGGRVRQLAGVVEVLDRQGNARLRLEPPFAVDARGQRHEARVQFTGGRLTVSLPASLRRYPALLDPGWTTTGQMIYGHYFHTITRLANGKVLVAGGRHANTNTSSTCELYDAVSDTWTLTGYMTTQRRHHAAVILSNGKVLAVGGEDTKDAVNSAELYDPATGKWTATGSMAGARYEHRLVILASGKVLALGGRDKNNAHLASAELYDPATGKWSVTGSLSQPRRTPTALLLPTGKVMAAGGYNASGPLASVELFDPQLAIWISGGWMKWARDDHAAVLLPNGQVLIAGGEGAGGKALATAELYNPTSGKYAATSHNMIAAREQPTSTLLASGKVLLTGGKDHNGNTQATAEVYDPTTDKWSSANMMRTARRYHAAALLTTSEVLITGGKDDKDRRLTSAELFDPTSGQSCTSGASCGTGHCVDGICCESACADACRKCVLETTAFGSLGRCTFVARGKADTSASAPCTGGKVCDGGGRCKLALGQACKAALDCLGSPLVPVSALGSSWKYHDLGLDLGTAWLAAGYDDSSWKSGKGQLGYGDGDETTTLYKPAASKFPSAYFRKKVTLASVPSMAEVKVVHDDGFALWINGTLVASRHVANGLSHSAWASSASLDNEVTTTLVPQTSAGPFQQGVNILAVMIKQVDSLSSDLSFDAALKVIGGAGFCEAGLCCDKPCAGTCQACDVSGKQGTCSLTPSGKPDLKATPPCSGASACDGKGACKLITAQSCSNYSQCLSGFCTDFRCCDTSCSAPCRSCGLSGSEGTCSLVAAGKEDPSATTPCTGSQACDGLGNCKKVVVQACTSSAQCVGGICSDGYCCISSCAAACKSCGVVGSYGYCVDLKQGTQVNTGAKQCQGQQACDGSGACRTLLGQACAASAECISGICVDGVCCDKACDATCWACNIKGQQGTCAVLPAGQADPKASTPCAATGSCDGKGSCLLALGQKCTKGKQCSSDECADGYCCDTACGKACQSCDQAGKLGSCTAHPAKTDPENDCIGKDAKCGGACDATGVCDFPGVGQGCGTCKACDGTGSCARTPPDDSACGVIDCDKLDTKCKDFVDLTTGRCDSLGACKKANDTSSCSKFTDLCGPDAGVTPDLSAAPDSARSPDKGSEPDSGSVASEDPDSGCQVAGAGPGAASTMLVLLALGIVRRRARSWSSTTRRR